MLADRARPRAPSCPRFGFTGSPFTPPFPIDEDFSLHDGLVTLLLLVMRQHISRESKGPEDP